MYGTDIAINILSDVIFVAAIAVIIWAGRKLIYWRRLAQALQFFNFDRDKPIRIFVSGFEHSGVVTKKVVNALELESALSLRDSIRSLSGDGLFARLVTFLARMIGNEISYTEPIIEPAPLKEVNQPLPYKSVILVGGPVANNLSDYYLRTSSPIFKFDEQADGYQRREGGEYRSVESSHDLAVIEKIIHDDQVVLLLHGFGEKGTVRAVKYLIYNWRHLYTKFGRSDFAIVV